MSALCIECETEIEEAPLCPDCAGRVIETVRLLKGKRKRVRPFRPSQKRVEKPQAEEEPRAPASITLPSVAFLKP